MSAGKFSGVAMHIIDRPSHSPHRAFLRTVNTVGGTFDADQLAVMQEVVRRWNAHERLVDVVREARNLAYCADQDTRRARLDALLRDLGEEG